MTPASTRRLVVLSPHLDDAALSCGGLAAAASGNIPVELWTVFASAPWLGPFSPLAQWLHAICGGKKGKALVRLRRREDRSAARLLGVNTHYFHFQDAVYRLRDDGSFAYSDTRLGEWDPADEKIIQSIAAAIRRKIGAADLVLCPLGAGSHVDHLIVRRAAEQSVDSKQLLYYPDLPYAAARPEDAVVRSAGLLVSTYKLTTDQISRWVSAVNCYSSQRRMLEEPAGPLDDLITNVNVTGLNIFARNELPFSILRDAAGIEMTSSPASRSIAATRK